MIKVSLFIVIMIIAISIHYYVFYYKPKHTNLSETLSNMCMAPSNKRNVSKNLDDIPKTIIEKNINHPEPRNNTENICYRPKINVLDMNHYMNKSLPTNNILNSNSNKDMKTKSNVQRTTLCTYTPSNDFVYQNDGPYEPSGSNQTMDYMSSKFLNDNLYQASFFSFSPSKNRIVYTDRPRSH
jgi:hypothetical protein